jgi:hypothetical protein
LCLSTQTVISLRLKLKRGLNALLPAHFGLGPLAFEYSIRDFFEPQNIVEACWLGTFLTQFRGVLSVKSLGMLSF